MYHELCGGLYGKRNRAWRFYSMMTSERGFPQLQGCLLFLVVGKGTNKTMRR